MGGIAHGCRVHSGSGDVAAFGFSAVLPPDGSARCRGDSAQWYLNHTSQPFVVFVAKSWPCDRLALGSRAGKCSWMR